MLARLLRDRWFRIGLILVVFGWGPLLAIIAAAELGEFGIKRLRARLDVRHHLSGRRPVAGTTPSGVQHDLVAMLGLRLARG